MYTLIYRTIGNGKSLELALFKGQHSHSGVFNPKLRLLRFLGRSVIQSLAKCKWMCECVSVWCHAMDWLSVQGLFLQRVQSRHKIFPRIWINASWWLRINQWMFFKDVIKIVAVCLSYQLNEHCTIFWSNFYFPVIYAKAVSVRTSHQDEEMLGLYT